MPKKPPRYDVPNAAPGPLRTVQQFVNTVNCESGEDWLASWLEAQDVTGSPGELDRARTVREALRQLLYANNLQRLEGAPLPVLAGAAGRAGLTIDFVGLELVSRAQGVDGAVGRVLAISYLAMLDGSWARLKCCRNHHCRWSFYDYSKNRSASWCSMQLCGNRRKTRDYRARRATTPSEASRRSRPRNTRFAEHLGGVRPELRRGRAWRAARRRSTPAMRVCEDPECAGWGSSWRISSASVCSAEATSATFCTDAAGTFASAERGPARSPDSRSETAPGGER